MKSFLLLPCIGFTFLAGCNQQTASDNNTAGNELKKETISCPPGSKLNIQKIEEVTGMKGTEKKMVNIKSLFLKMTWVLSLMVLK